MFSNIKGSKSNPNTEALKGSFSTYIYLKWGVDFRIKTQIWCFNFIFSRFLVGPSKLASVVYLIKKSTCFVNNKEMAKSGLHDS